MRHVSLSDYTCLQGIFGVWVGGHGLKESVSIRYPVTLKEMSNSRRYTSCSCFFCPFFLHFTSTPLFFFSLLPLSSLESKVKPSSVELENSESLFLKQVTATRHLTCPPLFFFFSSSFFLSVYILCLCLPLSVPILPLRLSSPPFLSPLPVPEGGEKEASQSHQCDLI